MDKLKVSLCNGKDKAYRVTDAGRGYLELDMEQGEVVWLQHRDFPGVRPQPLPHQPSEAMPFGQNRQ